MTCDVSYLDSGAVRKHRDSRSADQHFPSGYMHYCIIYRKKTFFLNVSNCPAFCITLHCLLLTTPEPMHLIAIHCFTFFKSSLLIQFSLYFEFSIFVQLFLLFLLCAFIGRSYHAVFLQNIVFLHSILLTASVGWSH